MLVANAGAVFASPEHGPSGGWVRRLDAQGPGCPQQSGQQRQQRGGAARGRALVLPFHARRAPGREKVLQVEMLVSSLLTPPNPGGVW